MRCWTCFSVSCHCSTPNFRSGPILRSRKYHTDCFYVCNRFVRHQPRHCLLDDRLVFRINDDCEEGSDAQRAVRVEQPSERQNREHLRRKEGVSHRHAKLAAAHPVEIIGGLPLIERLDDFNAVDVFDHGTAHLVGCLHRALVVLRIAAHD